MKRTEYIIPAIHVITCKTGDCLLYVSGKRVKKVDTKDGVDADLDWGGAADEEILDR